MSQSHYIYSRKTLRFSHPNTTKGEEKQKVGQGISNRHHVDCPTLLVLTSFSLQEKSTSNQGGRE